MPHAWIASDSEFGRVVAFRDALHRSGERYVVEVRADTLVRDRQARRPRRRRRWGRRREVPWRRVDSWAAQQPAARWQRLPIRAGAKGPLVVEVLSTLVQAWADGQTKRPAERLLVIRTVEEKPRTWYTLSNAAAEASLSQLTQAHACRHRGEEVFEEGKGEVGLGQYEVRRWDGWHHHRTLSLLALWFVNRERSRMRGKKVVVSSCQVRQIFTRLLRRPQPRVEQIVWEITCVLRRNEEAGIYHYLAHTGDFPPSRPLGDFG